MHSDEMEVGIYFTFTSFLYFNEIAESFVFLVNLFNIQESIYLRDVSPSNKVNNKLWSSIQLNFISSVSFQYHIYFIISKFFMFVYYQFLFLSCLFLSLILYFSNFFNKGHSRGTCRANCCSIWRRLCIR